MRDEDDIMEEIKVYERILESAKGKLVEAQSSVVFFGYHLKALNKELTEWQFTHGEKVYEPKREVDEEE